MHLNRKIYLIPKTLIDLVHWKYGFFVVVVSGFSLPPNVTLLLDSFPFWFFFGMDFLFGWVGGFLVVLLLYLVWGFFGHSPSDTLLKMYYYPKSFS